MSAPFPSLILLVLVSCAQLTTQATQPNCTDVEDFDDCQGDTVNFCPKGLACACKEHKPVCKCHAYRSGWQNYWYMGPDCDSLWSSLDLILIAALPAVALAVAVGVIIQWVNYCKNTPKESNGHSSTPAKEQQLHAEYNNAYLPEPAGIPRQVSQPPRRTDDEDNAQHFRFPRVPLRSQVDKDPRSPLVGGFSYLPHQPLRKAAPMGNGNADPPTRFVHPGYLQDDDDDDDVPSAEENPFSAMPMQQFPKPESPLYPQTRYPYHYAGAAVHDQGRRNQPMNYSGIPRSPYQ